MGTCSGNLIPFRFTKSEDYCYKNSKSVINDQVCLTDDSGGLSISVVNGKLECRNRSGRPTVIMSTQEYLNMCKKVAKSADYKYFTTKSFENPGNKLDCRQNNGKVVCYYSEDSLSQFPSSNNIFVGNGGNYFQMISN